MKLRIAFAAWAVVVLAVLVSCAVPNSPQGAAEQVLKAIDRLDFAKAKEFAVDDALVTVATVETLFGEMSQGQRPVAVNQSYIFGSSEEKDGETLVNYKLGNEDLVISAKKVGEDWKISHLGYEQIAALIPNNPTAVTEAFIGSFNTYNVAMAAPFASAETKKTLATIASLFVQMGTDDLNKAPKQPHPTILNVAEDGDRADVTFKIGDGKDQHVSLVKVDSVWKVDMKKDS